MTQEELDALMAGGELEMLGEQPVPDEETQNPEGGGERYRAAATQEMPPPATDDNKMVHQLDDVTKESEEKASEIFDIIEAISNDLAESEGLVEEIGRTMAANGELFETLATRFPDVAAFASGLERNRRGVEAAEAVGELVEQSSDRILNVMEIMQYQDIHRQKIERVINIMRALSTYMNRLFEGKIEDEKRVASATHLPGDVTTGDVVSSEDIEALIDSFSKSR